MENKTCQSMLKAGTNELSKNFSKTAGKILLSQAHTKQQVGDDLDICILNQKVICIRENLNMLLCILYTD